MDVVENQFTEYVEGWLYATQVVNTDMSEHSPHTTECVWGWLVYPMCIDCLMHHTGMCGFRPTHTCVVHFTIVHLTLEHTSAVYCLM